jgi:hypothetical protein
MSAVDQAVVITGRIDIYIIKRAWVGIERERGRNTTIRIS